MRNYSQNIESKLMMLETKLKLGLQTFQNEKE